VLKPQYPLKESTNLPHLQTPQTQNSTKSPTFNGPIQAKPEALLRRSAQAEGAPIARLAVGVVGRLERCEKGWCKVTIESEQGTFRGWIERTALWEQGLLLEGFIPSFLGVPTEKIENP